MLNFRLNAKPEQILLSEVLTKLATFYFIPRSLQVVTEFWRIFFWQINADLVNKNISSTPDIIVDYLFSASQIPYFPWEWFMRYW